jgi:hypothetical protein
MKETHRHEQGIGLVIVIMVLAFLLTVGMLLISIVDTGNQVAGNVRRQQQAFNVAEAGFDAAWLSIENAFVASGWTSFDTHYLQNPPGIDLPLDVNYFRRLTNMELLELIGDFQNGTPDYANILYYKQEYVPDGSGFDPRFTYTAFLIDDEAGGATPDAGDTMLVCIGVVQMGGQTITARLEVELAIELPGT